MNNCAVGSPVASRVLGWSILAAVLLWNSNEGETAVSTPARPIATYATLVTLTTFVANWGAVNGATSYRLDVATDSAFTNFVSGYQNLDVGNVVNKKVTGLTANATYYYRVRTYQNGSTSGNSNVISVLASPIITTVAGSGRPLFGVGGPATGVNIGNVSGGAVDGAGNLYVSDGVQSRIYKITPAGTLTVVAGNGTPGFSGDGGQATNAQLQNPVQLGVDSVGNLYFADSGNYRIRKVTPAGVITTVAGTDFGPAPNDGDLATSVFICDVSEVAVDPNDNFYFASGHCASVWKVLPNGTVYRVAGIGTKGPYSGDGGPARSATITPVALAFGPNGKLYIALPDQRVVVVTTDGKIHLFAGTGGAGGCVDNCLAVDAFIDRPFGVAVDQDNNVYISGYDSSTVRKVDSGGVISRIAGTTYSGGFSGDGGPAIDAQLSAPAGLAVDSSGNLFVMDTGNRRVRKIDSSGKISTFAGNGATNFFGDHGPATSAGLDQPNAVVVDAVGNLYIADTSNHRVRKVTTSGTITTLAGNGTPGFSGDNGPATAAMLNMPLSVAVDSAGNVYVADSNNFRIRKININGKITTFAGTGQAGCEGCGDPPVDGGLAVNAALGYVLGVGTDTAGNLYIADDGYFRVRKVDANGIITTVAGNGQNDSTGDGGLATNAALSPTRVSADNSGNLYISDSDHWHVRKVDSNGIITNLVGDGMVRGCMCLDYPGILITQVSVEGPAIVPDGFGDFYLTAGFNEIAKVFADGTFEIVDDSVQFPGFAGDGGPVSKARLRGPSSPIMDPDGNLLFIDGGNDRIRKVWLQGYPTPTTLANISTRLLVQTGDNVLIGGLIVTGTGSKQVILRALGPTLGQSPFNVPNALANPILELHDGTGALITSNDNWGNAANASAIAASGYAPPNNLESAILTNLAPGNYTAIVRGVNNTTGVALFDAFDLDGVTTKFGNISTRGFVGTGANVMIAGVIVHGPNSENVIIRGLGPTLAQFGVPNVLADPFLDLRDANGNQISTNDNWKSTQQAQIQATGYAPPNNAEAAILTTLTPGNYTAILSGVGNTSGNAIVEVYALN
jgi:sugar lactone lactonase YvrE